MKPYTFRALGGGRVTIRDDAIVMSPVLKDLTFKAHPVGPRRGRRRVGAAASPQALRGLGDEAGRDDAEVPGDTGCGG